VFIIWPLPAVQGCASAATWPRVVIDCSRAPNSVVTNSEMIVQTGIGLRRSHLRKAMSLASMMFQLRPTVDPPTPPARHTPGRGTQTRRMPAGLSPLPASQESSLSYSAPRSRAKHTRPQQC